MTLNPHPPHQNSSPGSVLRFYYDIEDATVRHEVKTNICLKRFNFTFPIALSFLNYKSVLQTLKATVKFQLKLINVRALYYELESQQSQFVRAIKYIYK